MIGKIFQGVRSNLPRGGAFALLTAAALVTVTGHPMPDVPVHSSFAPAGEVTITIDLDARCLAEDPDTAPYIVAKDYESTWTPEARAQLIESARVYLPSVVGFEFKPGGPIVPEFDLTPSPRLIEGVEETEEVLFLTATATVPLPPGAIDYRIHALDHGYLTVMFFNELAGKPVERFQALFPGETSYWLNLQRGKLEADPPLGAEVPQSTGAPWFPILIAALVLLAGGTWLYRRASTRA